MYIYRPWPGSCDHYESIAVIADILLPRSDIVKRHLVVEESRMMDRYQYDDKVESTMLAQARKRFPNSNYVFINGQASSHAGRSASERFIVNNLVLKFSRGLEIRPISFDRRPLESIKNDRWTFDFNCH